MILHTGGIATGAISDALNSRAVSCVGMMYLAVPTVRSYCTLVTFACHLTFFAQLFVYRSVGHNSYTLTVCKFSVRAE